MFRVLFCGGRGVVLPAHNARFLSCVHFFWQAWCFRGILRSGTWFCVTGAGHRTLFHLCGRCSTLGALLKHWQAWVKMRGGFGRRLRQYLVNLDDVLKGSKVSFCETVVIHFNASLRSRNAHGHLTRELLRKNLQRKNRRPQSVPWSNPDPLAPTVRTPQCGHTVWGKILFHSKNPALECWSLLCFPPKRIFTKTWHQVMTMPWTPMRDVWTTWFPSFHWPMRGWAWSWV